MKIIDLQQGSQEWLTWRKSIITATDCSCIMGSNPWTTEYKCWQRKSGLIDEIVSNEAMEKGKRLEPKARDLFIRNSGINMTPVCVESSDYSFLGASLDGISDCGKYLLEIKCGGLRLHNMAKTGIIPEYYVDQIQDQLFVTGAQKCFYDSYYEYEDGSVEEIIIEVYPDLEFQDKWIKKARSFWKCVAFNEAPAMTNRDYQDMNGDVFWIKDCQEYIKLDNEIKLLTEKKEQMKLNIISKCKDQSSYGGGLKIMKTTIKGRISYEDIPEFKSIDLEKYRKESTVSWKIMIEKDVQ